jgi:hypothetical protein
MLTSERRAFFSSERSAVASFYHHDVIAKLRRKSDCGLNTRAYYKPDDDEPFDTVPFQQQIQARIGESVWSTSARGPPCFKF